VGGVVGGEGYWPFMLTSHIWLNGKGEDTICPENWDILIDK